MTAASVDSLSTLQVNDTNEHALVCLDCPLVPIVPTSADVALAATSVTNR